MARILIIEDTEPVCQLYSFFLQRADANHDLVLTYTGEDGIRAALENQPDLVILDLNLPGISGAEVAQKLEESGILTTAPLIIATALGSDAAGAVSQSFNASALLLKPFAIDSMLDAVDGALTAKETNLLISGPGYPLHLQHPGDGSERHIAPSIPRDQT